METVSMANDSWNGGDGRCMMAHLINLMGDSAQT
jgi:hypothetical protein